MFPSFSKLPYELQSEVYSQYQPNLIQSRKVNQLTRSITNQSFIENICNRPISNQEINDYMTNVPDHIYFFYEEHHNEHNQSIHMGGYEI